jgi:hypothetical protein
MAGWITAFKIIPWAHVIAAAPAVVRGARRLWTAVREKDAYSPVKGEVQTPEARLQGLEARVEALAKELTAATELINSLAEQNARLVEFIGVLRIRTRVLLVSGAIQLALLAGLGAWIVSH